MLYVEYSIEKFSANGQLLEFWKKPSKSFLLGFIQTLYRGMSLDSGGVAAMLTAFDVTDTPAASTNYSNLFYCIGVSGKSRQYTRYQAGLVHYTFGAHLGIVVGTSNTAVSPSQTKLLSLIEHGTAAGELEYFGMLIADEADFNTDAGADEAYFEIERIFRNSSGGSVTIEEIGIYSLAIRTPAQLDTVFCILRDTDTIVVADGEYLKIKYRIKVAS